MGIPKFDKEDVFDNEILPLLREVKSICERENMPVLAAVVYYTDGTNTMKVGHVRSISISGKAPDLFIRIAEMLDEVASKMEPIDDSRRKEL